MSDTEINTLLAEIDLEDDVAPSPMNTVELDESASIAEQQTSAAAEDSPSAHGRSVDDTPAAPSSEAQPSTSSGSRRQPIKQVTIPDEVKEAASMAAAVTREAAADVAKEFNKIQNQAQTFFTNMWHQFDPLASTQANGQASKQDEIDVKERFGLEGSEKALESFRCTLIQTYAPSDNTFTPIKAIGFTGAFTVLQNNIAFEFDNPANGKAIVIPLSEVNKIERDPANGGSLVCRLVGGRTFCVGRFLHGGLELDSAEHLLNDRLRMKVDM